MGATTWVDSVPVLLVAALLLFVPGSVSARLAGLRWDTAICVGPVLTTSALVVTGVVAPAAGLPWGPAPLVLGFAVLVGGGALLGRLRRPATSRADGGFPWSVASLVLVGVVGLTGILAALGPVAGTPTRFPQSPDTIFHLGSIQWMLDERDISTLHAAGFASVSGTGFYPAAFHGVAATVALLSGASAVVSATTTTLVAAGLVWPLGVVLLARRVLGDGWGPTVAGAVSSVVFTAFPFWSMGYGVLWPNLFGQALLPATLALLISAVNGPGRVRAGVLGLAALPGLAVAHPNALIAFFLIGWVIVLEGLLRGAGRLRRRRRGMAAVLLAAAVTSIPVAAVGWWVLTRRSVGMRASNPAGPEMSVHDALLDAGFFGPRDLRLLWVAGALVVVAVLVLLVRRSQLWLPVAHLAIAGLYVLNTAVDTPVTRLLTWPWYNNSPRLAMLSVLTAAVLLAVALTEIGTAAVRALRGRLPLGGSVVVVTVVFLVVTAGGYVAPHRQILASYFEVPERRAWVSASELAALHQLGSRVPADAVVAANPWKGATYLYLTNDRRLLFATEKAWAPGDRALLGRELDEASTNPAVCAAARRQKVRYAIVGGSSVTSSKGQARRYAGIDSVLGAKGFTVVDRAGPYTLVRLDACG